MHLQLSTSPYKNGKELATGEPIKHLDDIRELHRCLLLPTEVAVVKCKGHTGGSDWISKGNEAADIAAMNAAGYILNQKNQMMVTSEEAPTLGIQAIRGWQAEASPEEKSMWKQMGAAMCDGLWQKDGKPVPSQRRLLSLIHEAHGPTHVWKHKV